jgi:hypothetical protein
MHEEHHKKHAKNEKLHKEKDSHLDLFIREIAASHDVHDFDSSFELED